MCRAPVVGSTPCQLSDGHEHNIHSATLFMVVSMLSWFAETRRKKRRWLRWCQPPSFCSALHRNRWSGQLGVLFLGGLPAQEEALLIQRPCWIGVVMMMFRFLKEGCLQSARGVWRLVNRGCRQSCSWNRSKDMDCDVIWIDANLLTLVFMKMIKHCKMWCHENDLTITMSLLHHVLIKVKLGLQTVMFMKGKWDENLWCLSKRCQRSSVLTGTRTES